MKSPLSLGIGRCAPKGQHRLSMGSDRDAIAFLTDSIMNLIHVYNYFDHVHHHSQSSPHELLTYASSVTPSQLNGKI